MLQLKNISVSYGPIEAVSDASIEVEQGQVVAIVGANGAGKTTLLKAIAGLMQPRTGEIVFEGQTITASPPHRRVQYGIALSPEGRQVFPDQSIRDNLELGAYARRLTTAELNEALEEQYRLFPRLRERQNQMSVTLSGGEQQMLAIARALMGAPRLLLLDEPSLGLAPLIIKEIFAIIRDLRSRGITILLVEQMANLALRLADRAYVLDSGRITMSGTGAELLAHPEIRKAYLGNAH
ncbi:ABC transporter ATP-binding protein [Bradyrhizobium sp. U87765 SZCCT0131]|uniref:ABC transporter ATP-binding protein n=1 Tax=unclassified Bradyrhizobium TaxID=2631580 RepID=UPI001BA7C368|nr:MULTISPECIES: ABC transporter ATP-binding protein [unclassified Bradyrhizobium]MBR1222550.1 ABC transporter ATP-binding protein [Bradyrhizobium sp. U87765 SZCCT0131]MBR1265369.1 ABC transporter ATP-binding protein [Bradyrhizobium sp. U87765 SZCCT0134]MBR1302852.1 ABC transporter ATP-binding protein [Bradyrhizobium sp. U87765 SZCCT0110]MBR1323550.1 ABC transporter ATP-binding protein [Bradyrhizobium sp. U87765 SZCCT0109]MBR1346781.1 ABC transporter ATP-binding protein [Bradyrhizobium sp. U87